MTGHHATAPNLKSHTMKPLILALSLSSLLAAEPVRTDPFDPLASDEQKPAPVARIMDLQGAHYFPEGTGLFTGPVLRSAGEMALKSRPDSGLTLRLTVMPTFGKPTVFRLYQRDGLSYLSVKRLSGFGGYELGHIELSGEFLVHSLLLKSLSEKTASARLSPLFNLDKEKRESMTTVDGVCWSLEVLAEGKQLQVIDVTAGLPLERIEQGLRTSGDPLFPPESMSEFIGICKTIYDLSGLDPGTLISG